MSRAELVDAMRQCDGRTVQTVLMVRDDFWMGITRFFKAIAGVPTRAYLTEVRFERAKALIRGTSKSMTQIAADCGFADQSHMTNVFRKRVGMTPTEFRSA